MPHRFDRSAVLQALRSPEGNLFSDAKLREQRIDPDDSDIVAARRVGELSRETRDPALRLVLQRQIPPDILGTMIANGELSQDDPQLRAAIKAMLEEKEGVSSANPQVQALIRQVTGGETGEDGTKQLARIPTPDSPTQMFTYPAPRTLQEISLELNQSLDSFGDELRHSGASPAPINLFLHGYRLRMAERDVRDEDTQARYERLAEEIERFQRILSHWSAAATKGEKQAEFFRQLTQRLIGVAGMYLSSYDTLRIDFIQEFEQIRTAVDLEERSWPIKRIVEYMVDMTRELEEEGVSDEAHRAYLLTFYMQAREVSENAHLLNLLYDQTLEEISNTASLHLEPLTAKEPEAEALEEADTDVSERGAVEVEAPEESQSDDSMERSPTKVLSFESPRAADVPAEITRGPGSRIASLPHSDVAPASELPFSLRLARPSEERHSLVVSIKRSWEFLTTLHIPEDQWPEGVLERLENPGEFPVLELSRVENYGQALYQILRLGKDAQRVRGEEPLPVERLATDLHTIALSLGRLANFGLGLGCLDPDVAALLENPVELEVGELARVGAYIEALSKACAFLRSDLGLRAETVASIVKNRLSAKEVIEKPHLINQAIAALRQIAHDIVWPEIRKKGRNGGLALIDFVDPETAALFVELALQEEWQNIPESAAKADVRERFRCSVAPDGVYGFLRDSMGHFSTERVTELESGRRVTRLQWGRLPTARYKFVEGEDGWQWRETE